MLALALAVTGGVSSAQSGELAPCPDSPNCVSSGAAPDDARHFTAPFLLVEPLAESWAKLCRAAEALPRATVLARTPASLHLEVRTRWLRFRDDLELVRRPDGRRVDVRSASRLGYSDLGANRARVESLRQALARAGVIEPGALDPES